MYYYQHHIGDFIRDTSNLSDSQCMAYLRLIWMYYDSEAPIQDSVRALAFKLGTNVETVDLLLEVFFIRDGEAWRHKRIDAEIESYKLKAQKARESANARWTNSVRTAGAMRTHNDGNATAEQTQQLSSKVDANQEPITNNQEEKKKKKGGSVEPDPHAPVICTPEMMVEIDSGLAKKFIAHRKQVKANGPFTVNAWQRHIDQSTKAGISPEAAMQYAISAGWQAFTAAYYLRAEGIPSGGQQKTFGQLRKEQTDAEIAEFLSDVPMSGGNVIDGEFTAMGVSHA